MDNYVTVYNLLENCVLTNTWRTFYYTIGCSGIDFTEKLQYFRTHFLQDVPDIYYLSIFRWCLFYRTRYPYISCHATLSKVLVFKWLGPDGTSQLLFTISGFSVSMPRRHQDIYNTIPTSHRWLRFSLFRRLKGSGNLLAKLKSDTRVRSLSPRPFIVGSALCARRIWAMNFRSLFLVSVAECTYIFNTLSKPTKSGESKTGRIADPTISSDTFGPAVFIHKFRRYGLHL